MQTVENTSDEVRVWPAIQTSTDRHVGEELVPAGTTLELEPGESAEVEDLPEDFEDPYLKVVEPPVAKVTPPAAPVNTPTQEPQL